MKLKNAVLLLTLMCITGNVLSHEGHNHDAPKTLSPLKGGIIKPFNIESSNGKKDANCFVEVSKSGKKDLKIYFFDKDQKTVNSKDFELVVSAVPFIGMKSEMESKSKVKSNLELLTLQDKGKFYHTSYDKKNSHKYDLVLKFKGPEYCKTNEEITFTID